MSVVFKSAEDLSDYIFRIVDNGGATADRYTVAFCDGSYLGMSGSPTHPQGVSMWGEGIDPAVMSEWVDTGVGVDLALGDLPEHLVKHIVYRNNEGMRDFLESVEARAPKTVAPSRDDAKINQGLHSDSGVGIYVEDDKFFLRLDGEREDDRGPYDTAREVVLASLPDDYALSGPEYHSTTEVSRLTPDAEVARKLAELEARVEAGLIAPGI